ncbi:MAG: hypothetical protein JNK11_21375 [Alphaproteobacteria bacterium]|nr:hypothetical protein [Alphaproteobacteria bacterium]
MAARSAETPAATPALYAELYDFLSAPISRTDCGRKCAPLNGGEPVCCSTGNAIPIAHKAEFALLKERTDLWHRFRPFDATSKKIVGELAHAYCAIECKGVAHCERDNRTLACRAFPFVPYVDRAGAFLGFTYFWEFEATCWVISNLTIVDRRFLKELVAAFEHLFAADPSEREACREHVASMRRIFTRQRRAVPVIGLDGALLRALPRTGKLVPARPTDFEKHGPYRSETAYKRAVKEAGGTLPPAPAGGYLAP